MNDLALRDNGEESLAPVVSPSGETPALRAVRELFSPERLGEALLQKSWTIGEEIDILQEIARNPDISPRERMTAAARIRVLGEKLLTARGEITVRREVHIPTEEGVVKVINSQTMNVLRAALQAGKQTVVAPPLPPSSVECKGVEDAPKA